MIKAVEDYLTDSMVATASGRLAREGGCGNPHCGRWMKLLVRGVDFLHQMEGWKGERAKGKIRPAARQSVASGSGSPAGSAGSLSGR